MWALKAFSGELVIVRSNKLLSKGRIKYGVTGSVTVMVRIRVAVSINITLFALHFIHRYSVEGAASG